MKKITALSAFTLMIVFAVITAAVLSGSVGFYFGRNAIVKTENGRYYSFNYKEAYLAEKAIANASLDLNHLWYSNDNNGYWFDVVTKTREYQKLDSCLNGDWEDFYYYETPLMWESITYKPEYSY